MGQLASRLAVLLRRFGGDERAWQPRLDAVADLEAKDPKRAHERFVELKSEIIRARHADLVGEFRRAPWIVDLPDPGLSGMNEKQIVREIVLMERALAAARGAEAAVAEARALAATLEERSADADFARFDAVPYAALAEAAEDAEALRRRVAREARVEARYADARSRAAKLKDAPVAVPDLSSAAMPDADAASALLDDAEARLKDAERVETLLARVRRELKDPATRDFTGERRRALLRRADAEAALADRDAAARALAESVAEAEGLRKEAAALAERASRARRRGGRSPERERKKGDLQDYFG